MIIVKKDEITSDHDLHCNAFNEVLLIKIHLINAINKLKKN